MARGLTGISPSCWSPLWLPTLHIKHAISQKYSCIWVAAKCPKLHPIGILFFVTTETMLSCSSSLFPDYWTHLQFFFPYIWRTLFRCKEMKVFSVSDPPHPLPTSPHLVRMKFPALLYQKEIERKAVLWFLNPHHSHQLVFRKRIAKKISFCFCFQQSCLVTFFLLYWVISEGQGWWPFVKELCLYFVDFFPYLRGDLWLLSKLCKHYLAYKIGL